MTRLAHEQPVSLCDGRAVLVTDFAESKRVPATPKVFAAPGACRGRHQLVPQGTPCDEIASAVALLKAAGADQAAGALPDPSVVIRPPGGLCWPRCVISMTAPIRPRSWLLGFLLWAAGARDLSLVDVAGR
ncbi:hypothetical protein [Amycolatopsis sp. cmx-8-4]|uniref:hypothetical protein n=1 Tax=Amycolatopsis sp. cmx-8-4 TaxID=2790947 RepID=UPI003979E768